MVFIIGRREREAGLGAGCLGQTRTQDVLPKQEAMAHSASSFRNGCPLPRIQPKPPHHVVETELIALTDMTPPNIFVKPRLANSRRISGAHIPKVPFAVNKPGPASVGGCRGETFTCICFHLRIAGALCQVKQSHADPLFQDRLSLRVMRRYPGGRGAIIVLLLHPCHEQRPPDLAWLLQMHLAINIDCKWHVPQNAMHKHFRDAALDGAVGPLTTTALS
mmetsp:Transcript_72784/g.121502  ORF Transcript_72784/g.121502 Transcript_72784/m.121502 type:complete len:220 (+) Transcript_72784:255-914(+)